MKPITYTCSAKRHRTEEAARLALWALKQNRRQYADALTPKPCKLCKGWHLTRTK